ncbi:hypothetical protein PDJAM_G00209360 [Pangasius djambal]|uniref:Uncharacterized protein n=1 Tax=Pangasius djambal TaxID=1691987 RepID=A0ACC5YA67_9TELE|nr:hypothetical protein [Pangasius djambal]
MIRRPIVIDGILKGACPGGFGGRADGGDGQRIAILAGGGEERIARGSLGKEQEKKNTPAREAELRKEKRKEEKRVLSSQEPREFVHSLGAERRSSPRAV